MASRLGAASLIHDSRLGRGHIRGAQDPDLGNLNRVMFPPGESVSITSFSRSRISRVPVVGNVDPVEVSLALADGGAACEKLAQRLEIRKASLQTAMSRGARRFSTRATWALASQRHWDDAERGHQPLSCRDSMGAASRITCLLRFLVATGSSPAAR